MISPILHGAAWGILFLITQGATYSMRCRCQGNTELDCDPPGEEFPISSRAFVDEDTGIEIIVKPLVHVSETKATESAYWKHLFFLAQNSIQSFIETFIEDANRKHWTSSEILLTIEADPVNMETKKEADELRTAIKNIWRNPALVNKELSFDLA
jgi:hypothetical protein